MGPALYVLGLFIFLILGMTGLASSILAFSSSTGLLTGFAWLTVSAISFLAIAIIELSQRVSAVEFKLDDEDEE